MPTALRFGFYLVEAGQKPYAAALTHSHKDLLHLNVSKSSQFPGDLLVQGNFLGLESILDGGPPNGPCSPHIQSASSIYSQAVSTFGTERWSKLLGQKPKKTAEAHGLSMLKTKEASGFP